MGFYVADVFGGDEAFAVGGCCAGGQERCVEGEVAAVLEVYEGEEGCCAGGVED